MSLPNCLPLAAIGDLSSGRIWAIVLGTLLAIVAISLLIASWTKWGQTKSLTKCIALAFLAHVWLLMYAYGTRIVTPGLGGGTQGGVATETISMSVPILATEEPSQAEDSTALDSSQTEPAKEEQPAPWEAPIQRLTETAEQETNPRFNETPRIPDLLPSSFAPSPLAATETLLPELPAMDSVERIEQMAANPNQTAQHNAQRNATSPSTALAQEMGRSALQAMTPSQPRRVDQQPLPTSYQMRLSPLRSQYALQNGGDMNTESSVERALEWLAQAQGPDGSWNAAEHGAGNVSIATRKRAESESRDNAGRKANTAMTGLALLAFLGAGHTHTDGRYKDKVTAGLQYLLAQQFERTGDLSGRDQVGDTPTVRFARMYSHGMAALSLAEAYGMTGDPVLLPPIRKACEYSHSTMNRQTGGWRYGYNSDDPGDLSQFGWQAMLLNSAATHRTFELSPNSRFLMQRFLDSVSTGRHGGLAVYRPVPIQMVRPENATPAMTAEAMASRLLLGFPLTAAAAEEGQRMLLNNLPGRSEENLYYWYYATLALYQLRGDRSGINPSNSFVSNTGEAVWNQWNEAIKQQLCSTQVARGASAGSWNPSCVWGDYGGRVYSTAMACMCLEVYYRYLPMYKPEQFANQWQPARR